ncbi:undecaprenyldiphospho-muramoylpentapeptide beta-N-acetylglucosaminyltransferase [Bacteroidota bacterium]
MKKQLNIIISGGGTGGHVFPAISIANALKEANENIEILFVGANGRIEMDKVPAAGYKIIGLPIYGFQRKKIWKNFKIIFNLLRSLNKARNIIKKFKPDVAVGVGGYASGPVLRIAGNKGIPTVIQEQNSYAGITNKLLAKKAHKIFVAYDGMEKYFPKEKIILSGNPVRRGLIDIEDKSEKAFNYFDLDINKKTVLAIGGSLGARSINLSLLENYNEFVKNDIQLIWQTGKLYYTNITYKTGKVENGIKIMDFISEMEHAYAVADVIISRAGAGTISELCIVGKPVVLVPSPNVAEDHQTKNATALVNEEAVVMVKDSETDEKLVSETISLFNDEEKMKKLSNNIKKLAIKDSASIIANEILKLVG